MSDDTTKGLRELATESACRAFAGQPPDEAGVYELAAERHPWTALDDALAAVWAVVSPVLDRYRKAVEEAPGGAIWTGACIECGAPIELSDAITWRLRWSPQGPIHEECR
jgi:hypothetical protein